MNKYSRQSLVAVQQDLSMVRNNLISTQSLMQQLVRKLDNISLIKPITTNQGEVHG